MHTEQKITAIPSPVGEDVVLNEIETDSLNLFIIRSLLLSVISLAMVSDIVVGGNI